MVYYRGRVVPLDWEIEPVLVHEVSSVSVLASIFRPMLCCDQQVDLLLDDRYLNRSPLHPDDCRYGIGILSVIKDAEQVKKVDGAVARHTPVGTLTFVRQQRSGDSHLTNGSPRSTALHAFCRLWAWRAAGYGRTPRHAKKGSFIAQAGSRNGRTELRPS